jgi:ubiquitin C-terminal hydrolase
VPLRFTEKIVVAACVYLLCIYFLLQEAGDLSHAVASARAWEKHQLRNRSAVVDLMHGQYRSTVVCPTEGCGRVSVTFDPFQVVTLQLPAQSVRNMKVRMRACARVCVRLCTFVSVCVRVCACVCVCVRVRIDPPVCMA